MSAQAPLAEDTDGPERQGRRVRSAERVAAVLHLLAQSDQPLRHSQVAESLSMPKSSASNLLDTLADVRLISKTDQGYSLGVWLLELGQVVAERLDIRTIARPVMEELSRMGVGTCNFATLQGSDITYLEKVSNPAHPIQIATRVGGTLPAHATAMGKVMVAWLPEPDRSEWVARQDYVSLTEHTITSAADFAAELERVIETGYGIDNQESHRDVICVGAPVRDHTHMVKYAMSLTCLRSDIEERGIDTVAAEVIAAADRVSKLLGN